MAKKAKRTKSQGRYSPTLKREVARRYLAGEFSYQVAAEEYQLRDKTVVKEFVKWYKRQSDYLSLNVGQMDQSSPESVAGWGELSHEQLLEQLQAARLAAEQAQLEAEAWKTLVRIAEAELEIEIVKKSGAKPCKK